VKKEMKLTLWLLSIGALITLGLVVSVILFLTSDSTEFTVEEQWLYVDLRVPMYATPQSGGIFDDPADTPPLTTDVAYLIRTAANDESILGIRVEMGGLNLGWAQVQELRDAFVSFTEAGKECKVWSETYSNKEYYLATACNEVSMPPAGIFLVNGLSMSLTYYKDFFDEWQIKPNFAHVGDFKSAVEPYERTGPSEAASEATNALLDSMYGEFIKSISTGRQLTKEATLSILDNPPITPNQALEKQLVDNLQYRDQFLLKDKEDIQFRHWKRYRESIKSSWENSDNNVAVIYAEGTIMPGSSGSSFLGASFIGDKTIRQHLQQAIDTNAKAIVIRISSPGGSGSASDSIWRDIQRVKEMGIPVVISMGDYAASGGYYIAMGSDYIFAQPTTITGSIGVFGGKFNLSGLYEKFGLHTHTYKRGEFSTLFSSMEDFDENSRKKYQDFLESFYQIFISKAALGRNMSIEDIHTVAQGRVWTGEQALQHKLIDEIGGLDKAIYKASELAGLSSYQTIQIPQTLSFWEEVLEEMQSTPDEASLQLLPGHLKESLSMVMTLERILNEDGKATLLPMQISFQ
jgi:protease IV